MATFYIPDATGWYSTRLAGSGGGYLRIRIDQTYNSASNTSSLTTSVEMRAEAYRGLYDLRDGGSFTFPSSGSGAVTIDHHYHVQMSDSWSGIYYEGEGTKYWTSTVAHAADGTCSIYGGITAAVKQHNASNIWQWSGKSGTLSLSNTPSYTLTLNLGAHTGAAVKRNGTALSNGATIYRGDTLVFSYSPDAGYQISTHTVNGAVAASGYSFTVNGAVSVVTTAYVKYWTLILSPDSGAYISASRTSSPLQGAATGALANGDTIYYGDVLAVEAGAQSGYVLGSCTVNGEPLESPYTVTGPVTIVATTTQAGAWLKEAGGFASYQILIFNGNTWDTYIPYVYTGSGWEVY